MANRQTATSEAGKNQVDNKTSSKQQVQQLADYTIRDRAGFQAVAGSGYEIAGLYALARLDVLVDLARLIALDFFARPEMYKELTDPDLAEKLAQLNARYGCDERLLDHDQRKAVFTPLFDDAAGDFVKSRDELLSAAATYATWGQATGIPILREVVRTKHVPFKQHLTRFSGASLAWSRGTALPYLTDEVSYRILRDHGVTSVFGISRPPRDAWPYQEDADGDQLVEEVCKRLDPNEVRPFG
jgi:hypothetical protein